MECKGKMAELKGKCHGNININIVECKVGTVGDSIISGINININIVECKGDIYWFMRTGGCI